MSFELDLNSHQTAKYLQVYDYYKNLILSGKLSEGTKMPSIRRCCEQLGLSRTTIETAYLYLASDGYIISRPQSGYYVTKRINISKPATPNTVSEKKINSIKYNFTSSNVDKESFNFKLWRRYIKSALRQDQRLLSYGEPQGEYDLRQIICEYVISKRNAVCKPENIIIGAGSQSLLNILCPLIKDRESICFNDTQFKQGQVIFEDYGFKISDDKEEANILYMTPSHMTSLGDVMPFDKRLSLLQNSVAHNTLIIEDDYNNEFRYFSKPRPCLQGLAGGENVVYLSTFSKLLLPSIRLSFMILPDNLLAKYEQKKEFYNQTASKAEQLALCQFLRDGHLDSQIRKLKRLYTNKAKMLALELETVFGDNATVSLDDSVFLVHLKMKSNMSTNEFVEAAASHGILVFPAPSEDKNTVHIALSCSEIPMEEYHEACRIMYTLLC